MKAVVFASLVLIGCGGKKDDKPAGDPAPEVEDKETKQAEPAPEPTEKAAAPATDTTPPPEDFAHGHCTIKASGDITFEQKVPHYGGVTLNVFQWHTPEMRAKMGYPDEGIILNCLGNDIRLNLLAREKDTKFPMQPATYKAGAREAIRVMGTLRADGKTLSITKSDGSLEITAFDDKRIAGKGTIQIETLPGKKKATLDIDFDMQCWGLSGCP